MEEVKFVKRKPGQSAKKLKALRFALNESLGDKAMMAEIQLRPYDPDEKPGLWHRSMSMRIARLRANLSWMNSLGG